MYMFVLFCEKSIMILIWEHTPLIYQFYWHIKSVRPCINEKIAVKSLSEHNMENVIVKEGSTIKGWMFSEESMALVIFIVWYFQNKMET